LGAIASFDSKGSALGQPVEPTQQVGFSVFSTGVEWQKSLDGRIRIPIVGLLKSVNFQFLLQQSELVKSSII